MQHIRTDTYTIYIGNDSLSELDRFLAERSYSSLVFLVDENTKKKCFPSVKRSFSSTRSISVIQVKSGEKNKNLKTCEKIWKELSKINADRRCLLINLGGGVISDLGGFAASTYKRGIAFINIPTTLLSQVDASVGGKTGIDFLNLKNQIGTFTFPQAVFIVPEFLHTLNKRELLSGYAEMIKHGLIADSPYWTELQRSSPLTSGNWEETILRSVQIKNDIVTKDPYEKNLRKALNFGHTVGHALESASLRTKKKLLHGEAIAMGMICEAYLSRKCSGLTSEELDAITRYITTVFKPEVIKFSAKQLIALMKQDKKNKDSEINFSLLKTIGTVSINYSCSDELIEESLQFLNELNN